MRLFIIYYIESQERKTNKKKSLFLSLYRISICRSGENMEMFSRCIMPSFWTAASRLSRAQNLGMKMYRTHAVVPSSLRCWNGKTTSDKQNCLKNYDSGYFFSGLISGVFNMSRYSHQAAEILNQYFSLLL